MTIDAITPAAKAADVTPHDTNNIDPTRGILVGTSGDLRVMMLDGTDIIIHDIAAGIIHPIQVVRVYNTNTTASDIIAFR